ncbi:SDR family oxidoreductase [Halopseudomonas pachastrellae]|nr:SDR family oxidoreductase [Halopseudomonas pachastrellae]
MTLNVDVCFLVAQEVARRFMIPRKSGKIINIASIAGFKGNRANSGIFTSAYNTSKAACDQPDARAGWRVGPLQHQRQRDLPGLLPDQTGAGPGWGVSEMIKEGTPLGRIGGDEDIKGAAVFFATEMSRHVTGQAMAVDGGNSVV